MIKPGSVDSIKPTATFCVVPKLSGVGGPASFQNRLVSGLESMGYEVTCDTNHPNCSALLVIGGPARLAGEIWRARRRGIRVVQRLNGRNWLHRKGQGNLRYFLRAELNNLALTIIRNHLTDRIVYQSRFAEEWWTRSAGTPRKQSQVIYNSVDLKKFTAEGTHNRPEDHYRLLVVEGHLGGGYEQGLENAIALTRHLNTQMDKPVELMVVGEVSDLLRAHWEANGGVMINWMGLVNRERIPEIDRSAHLMFSSDLNAACPNSVIEALACGLPVVGFATGALPEILGDQGGKTVNYGGDYWNLEPADVPSLATAAAEVLYNLPAYRTGARKQAEAEFDLNSMVEKYLKVLL
jgi:glycosyltransferase involved in cell wall biosynthesis